MKLIAFQELVRRIVHLSTRDGKPIPISWSGTTAYTSTSVVNIPALPAGTVLTQSQFSIWLGYTIHEGPGHQTHTDLSLYEIECRKRNNPTFSYIFNLLEDIRIENADIAKYPGDRKYLDAVHQFVDNQIPIEVCKNPDLLGQIYKHLFVEYRSLDTKRLTGTLTNKQIKAALAELPNCKSTFACALLADKIVSLLPKAESPPNDPQTPTNTQQPDSSDSSSQSESPNNNFGGETSPTTDPAASDPSGSNSDVEADNSSNSSGNPNSPSPANYLSPSDWEKLIEIKNIIEKLASETATANGQPNTFKHETQNGKSYFPPADISLDRIFIPSSENLPQYLQTRAELAPQLLSLKKMFRIYLQSWNQKSWLRGLEEGETLDRDRLHVASTGASTIFKTRHSKPFVNTAVSLMIDLSSSMDGDLTRGAAIILSEALASIPQIKLAISGFTTNYSRSYNRRPPANLGRCSGMDILLFKDFETPYAKSRAKLGAIKTSRLTPLGDAYGKALEQLIPRPEPRKILFLLTDGQPEFACGSNHSDYLLMENIKTRAAKLKIETFGLGIGENVETFLPKYVEACTVIKSPQTLPADLMAALKRII